MGKTTLLASVMGLSTRHRGHIRVDGNDLDFVPTDDVDSVRQLPSGYGPYTLGGIRRSVVRGLTGSRRLARALAGLHLR